MLVHNYCQCQRVAACLASPPLWVTCSPLTWIQWLDLGFLVYASGSHYITGINFHSANWRPCRLVTVMGARHVTHAGWQQLASKGRLWKICEVKIAVCWRDGVDTKFKPLTYTTQKFLPHNWYSDSSHSNECIQGNENKWQRYVTFLFSDQEQNCTSTVSPLRSATGGSSSSGPWKWLKTSCCDASFKNSCSWSSNTLSMFVLMESARGEWQQDQDWEWFSSWLAVFLLVT